MEGLRESNEGEGKFMMTMPDGTMEDVTGKGPEDIADMMEAWRENR